MSDRYFYHSFPRRPGIDRAARGLSILKSILDRGLLLTPEIIAFREQLRGGGQAPEWRIAQKRICFTELSPRELPPHAETFGPFALEFEIEALRKMGAIPTLYVPLRANPDALDGLGAAALARLGEAQQVLARLTQLNHLVRDRPPGETLNITRNATPIAATRATVGAAADLLSCLTAGTQPVTVLDAALRWISGLLYPVENLQYTEPLAYYRQREWRILANAVHEGIPISRTPTSDDIGALLVLDAEFFGRELDFPTGRRRRVDECQFLSAVRGRPVMGSVRRIIVPHAVEAEAERLMNERVLRCEVASLESLGQSDG